MLVPDPRYLFGATNRLYYKASFRRTATSNIKTNAFCHGSDDSRTARHDEMSISISCGYANIIAESLDRDRSCVIM